MIFLSSRVSIGRSLRSLILILFLSCYNLLIAESSKRITMCQCPWEETETISKMKQSRIGRKDSQTADIEGTFFLALDIHTLRTENVYRM